MSLGPAFHALGRTVQLLRMEDGVAPLIALDHVVPERDVGLLPEDHADGDVNQRHDAHDHVGDVPGEGGLELRAGEDHEHCDDPVARHERLVLVGVRIEVLHALLGVEVVADERRVGEDDERAGEQHAPARPEGGAHAVLEEARVVRARLVRPRVDARAEQDERRRGADQDRVDEDREQLREALLHRVGHVGGRGRVRRRAHAGLVRVESALDAVHDRRPQKAAEGRLHVEGLCEDARDDVREVADVQHHDRQRQHDVADRHDRHEELRDAGDEAATAHDHEARERREREADVDGRVRDALHVVADEVRRVEGRQRVEAAHVQEDDEAGEDAAEDRRAERLADRVGRAAVERAIRVPALVDLRERALDERRRAAEDRDEPHPEHRAGTAREHGRGHADDVARPDARRGRDHQGLEGRQRLPVLLLLAEREHGLLQQGRRQELEPGREIEAAEHQQRDENVAVEVAVDRVDERVDRIHHGMHSYVVDE